MNPDRIHTLDILIAARHATEFLSGISEEQFKEDEMRQLAVLKVLEILDAAAGSVSEDFRSEHPEVPWSELTTIRRRLMPDYYSVELSGVWRTVRGELTPLIPTLEDVTD